METSERRMEIMRTLCKLRYETVENLAFKFGVSERTVRRDIEALSRNNPIYTLSGRYKGGVYVMEGYTMDRMYMNGSELNVLRKLADTEQVKNILTIDEQKILKSIIMYYAKPILKGRTTI